MVEPEAPDEPLLLPLELQPVAISARETAPTTAADSLVRRENFTVTPLCAWMGETSDEHSHSFVGALSQDRANTKNGPLLLSRHFWERSQIELIRYQTE